jgi:5-enolpyruvylshikimate-3-phosphate synthase
VYFRCGDMFENGSYLRRRKRFKLLKKSHAEQTVNQKKVTKKELPLSSPIKSQQIKSSFFIDNLLANDTTSSSSSEANSTLQHLLYTTDFDIVRKLTFFSDINGQQQQVYW